MISTLPENILFETPPLHSNTVRDPGTYATKTMGDILEIEDLNPCVP